MDNNITNNKSELCSVARSSMHPCPEKKWLQSGVRSCIMPELPMHLVQVLNAGTVGKSSVPQLKPKINTLYILFLNECIRP